MNFFKKLFIPSGTKTVTAYQSWTVRWYSVYNPYSWMNTQHVEQMEIFPSQVDADAFANALIAAFKLTKSPDLAKLVKVSNNQTKLATVKK